ncbi:hypothetical protein NDU88_012631 [Pleurodeles waltl]|uniref:Uncharacterized protein n=1 Tax=Pleurodeles waltl TaxID=8319 RepID=A0AAV7R0L9_PLEWA|nr:hypothetical protein NDU88_012631 [Pleurodeles waltl]
MEEVTRIVGRMESAREKSEGWERWRRPRGESEGWESARQAPLVRGPRAGLLGEQIAAPLILGLKTSGLILSGQEALEPLSLFVDVHQVNCSERQAGAGGRNTSRTFPDVRSAVWDILRFLS